MFRTNNMHLNGYRFPVILMKRYSELAFNSIYLLLYLYHMKQNIESNKTSLNS